MKRSAATKRSSHSMGRALTVVLCLLALTLATGLAVGVETAPETASGDERIEAGGTAVPLDTVGASDDPLGILAQEEIEADRIVMIADIRDDGSAQWRVEYRLELDDEQEEQAFEDLQDDIEADPAAYLDPFVDRMERTVANAEESTGREMTASNFDIRTDRSPQPDTEFGIVTFQFEWDGFAAVEDDGETIRAGDAIDRLFLEEGVNLQIGWPQAFSPVEVDPEPAIEEPQRVVWRGELDFDDGQPRVVLTSADVVDDGVTDDEPADDDTGVDPAEGEGILTPLTILVAIAVAVLAGAAAFVLRSRDTASTATGAGAGADGTDNGDAAGAASTPPAAEGPPPELLSNEEQVLQLLEQHGGRMKQQEVVEQLDWTAAKTSQVVGDLREEDKIESFRLGRENVLTLPDVDLETDTDSGSDDADRTE